MLAAVSDLAVAAPLAFLLGLVIGLFLCSFYRIVKRNGGR